jgi:hypothetical protein
MLDSTPRLVSHDRAEMGNEGVLRGITEAFGIETSGVTGPPRLERFIAVLHIFGLPRSVGIVPDVIHFSPAQSFA